jgi:hypothetical protein
MSGPTPQPPSQKGKGEQELEEPYQPCWGKWKVSFLHHRGRLPGYVVATRHYTAHRIRRATRAA